MNTNKQEVTRPHALEKISAEYPIHAISRGHIDNFGFDASQIDDQAMERLADATAGWIIDELGERVKFICDHFKVRRKAGSSARRIMNREGNNVPSSRVVAKMSAKFPINPLCRDSLESLGYDMSGIDDQRLKEIGDTIADYTIKEVEYCVAMACESDLKIPKKTIKTDPRGVRGSRSPARMRAKFPIVLSREVLKSCGYDASRIDDQRMKYIADAIGASLLFSCTLRAKNALDDLEIPRMSWHRS